MEILKKRYDTLLQAFASLQSSLTLIEKYSNIADVELHAACRDSCIQRFKYLFDGFWKFIKLYLEEVETIHFESNAPRAILKEAENINIISTNEDLKILLEALSDRNLTSHSYNVAIAEKIVSHIPLYYKTMHVIATQLKFKII